MTNVDEKALLPVGLSDRLPPDAAFEAQVRESLVSCFMQHGFECVKPPLVEFEENLLTGTGNAMTGQTFRLMDPVSQRMMGIRADMTPQVARLATTRLAHVTRPLRLCYAGDVLRIKGSQLRPERQFTQAGAEIIGIANAEADAEIIMLAADSLTALGVQDLKIDICQPVLTTSIIDEYNLPDEVSTRLRHALDRKDTAEVLSLTEKGFETLGSLLVELLAANGPAERVIETLASLQLRDAASAVRDSLLSVVAILQAQAPNLSLTLDAVENRGFEYHSGVTFTIFARGVRGELGSGGRYLAGQDDKESVEPAVGFSLFLDSILRAIEPKEPASRIYVPSSAGREVLSGLHKKGYRTVIGYAVDHDINEAARALNCQYTWTAGQIKEVQESN